MKSNAECFDLVSHELHTLFTTVVSGDEPEEVKEASKHAEGTLDAVCKKANVTTIANECEHSSAEQCNELFMLLKKYETSFYRTLGEWDATPVSLEVKPREWPFHRKAYQILHAYEQILKKEAQRLIDTCALAKCSDSE